MRTVGDRFPEFAERHSDTDTVDLVTTVVTELEKNGWFLRATIEG